MTRSSDASAESASRAKFRVSFGGLLVAPPLPLPCQWLLGSASMLTRAGKIRTVGGRARRSSLGRAGPPGRPRPVRGTVTVTPLGARDVTRNNVQRRKQAALATGVSSESVRVPSESAAFRSQVQLVTRTCQWRCESRP